MLVPPISAPSEEPRTAKEIAEAAYLRHKGNLTHGAGTWASVIKCVNAAYGENPRRATGYTLPFLLEKLYRRESIISEKWSFVWWHLDISEGVLSVVVDGGKRRSFWHNGNSRAVFYNPIQDEGYEPAGLCKYESILYFMMRHGVSLGQKILSAVKYGSSTDYWGEFDSWFEDWIIYAEPSTGVDIPLSLTADFMPRRTRAIEVLP